MAKPKKEEKSSESELKDTLSKELPAETLEKAGVPKEVQDKLKQIREKLDKFSKEVNKKFGKYIMGVSLLPPLTEKEQEEVKKHEGEEAAKKAKEKINILVLVDDTDSKISKQELIQKLTTIMNKVADDIDKKFAPQPLLLSEVWQSCYDAKYDLLRTIANSAPVYDKGMLSAIKIAEVHKRMVLEKFEKYIVAYVLAGSLVQGKATPESDVDVFIVIDDTDVKKMTRAELKDKLRAIIIGMGVKAGELTGIKNKINIQVYILTDFWDSIKEAHPVIFTFLRDGIPFYDRGIFMPWKQLLKMGRIKPSSEAIEMYLSSGEQLVKRIQLKLNDIGIEDLFYALLTPSQAALMMHGIPPPTPNETPRLLREIFVQKEKLFEESYVNILEKVIKIRKSVEHGTKKNISGKEIDQLLSDADKYLSRLKKLFSEIEKRKEAENVVQVYDTATSLVRDALRLEGIERVKDGELANMFKNALVETGKLQERLLRSFKDLLKAKKDYDSKKLTKTDIQKVRKSASPFIREMIEYIQRKRGRELERARIRVKYGGKYGEVVILDENAYIIEDLDAKEKKVQKASITKEGGISNIKSSSYEEFENAMMKMQMPPKVFIKERLFEDMKEIFGENVEILVNY